MMSYLGIILLLLGVPRDAAALECYSCNGISDIDSCQNLVTCDTGQSCFTTSQTNRQTQTFSMGCTDNDNCGSIPVFDSMSGSSGETKCNECCGYDKCNKLLCKHKQPPPCEDTMKDCSYWNKKFDICNTTHEAKVVCRKFCKLCSLVDGNWADWSSWSSCDVTCDNGKHTRIRTCSNPAPAYQGLDCEGTDISTKPCIRPLCPVHGGWTDWSDWGSCPVTCGSGIQKRHRNCSNPYPLRYGDHCFGDDMDVKICMPSQCDIMDGGWTDWGLWTSCSSSCGWGLRKRSRSCTNPRPDPYGKPCDGDPIDMEICNNQPCQNTSVAFNAYNVTNRSPSKNQVLMFSNILVNEGGSYNSSTGLFIAPRNGTYQFNAQICGGFRTTGIQFDIMVENVSYAAMYNYDYYQYNCPSTHTVAVLQTDDTVFVRWNSGSIYQDTYRRNSFSGTWLHD